jgi:hypothetical protein
MFYCDQTEIYFERAHSFLLSNKLDYYSKHFFLTPPTPKMLSTCTCRFRLKPATHSGLNLPGIPVQTCHLFRIKVYQLKACFRNSHNDTFEKISPVNRFTYIFLSTMPNSLLQIPKSRRDQWRTGEYEWRS